MPDDTPPPPEEVWMLWDLDNGHWACASDDLAAYSRVAFLTEAEAHDAALAYAETFGSFLPVRVK